jgi:hypothetical protein
VGAMNHNINALNESNQKDLLNVVKPVDRIFNSIENYVDNNQRTEGLTVKVVDKWIKGKKNNGIRN